MAREILLFDDFLTAWAQAEMEAIGELAALRARAAREADELGEDEALVDAARVFADKRGLMRSSARPPSHSEPSG
jgi:hypothetical protein